MIGLCITIVLVLAILLTGMWLFEHCDEEDRNDTWKGW